MIKASQIVAAARVVRVTAVVFVLGLLVGLAAISSFAGQYGRPVPMVLDARSSDSALAAAISRQESAGLTCSARPALVDVVLFQRNGESGVSIMTFDAAVAASGAGAGWIRRYCVKP